VFYITSSSGELSVATYSETIKTEIIFIDRLSYFGKKVSESRKGYLSYVKKGEEIYSKGRRKVQVEAGDLLCYWAVRELGISCTDLAKQLEMTQPGVGYAVNRGVAIAVIYLFIGCPALAL